MSLHPRERAQKATCDARRTDPAPCEADGWDENGSKSDSGGASVHGGIVATCEAATKHLEHPLLDCIGLSVSVAVGGVGWWRGLSRHERHDAGRRTLIFSFALREQQNNNNRHARDDNCPSDCILCDVIHKTVNTSRYPVIETDLHDHHFRLLIIKMTTPTTAKATAKINNSHGPGIQAIMFNILSDYEAALQTIDAEGFYCTSEAGAKCQHPAARLRSR
ncbi:MAG: hypothetical protein IID41_13395 [Planctomycetes bacterium]|nr:hypothetical protein [Planctomycetota bacterium]